MSIQPPHSHWVFDWLDLHNIRDLEHAHKQLESWRAFDELKELASAAHRRDLPAVPEPATALLAARGLDLSGELTYNNPSCRRAEVDQLFRSIWHYFDQIVVGDVITPISLIIGNSWLSTISNGFCRI